MVLSSNKFLSFKNAEKSWDADLPSNPNFFKIFIILQSFNTTNPESSASIGIFERRSDLYFDEIWFTFKKAFSLKFFPFSSISSWILKSEETLIITKKPQDDNLVYATIKSWVDIYVDISNALDMESETTRLKEQINDTKEYIAILDKKLLNESFFW